MKYLLPCRPVNIPIKDHTVNIFEPVFPEGRRSNSFEITYFPYDAVFSLINYSLFIGEIFNANCIEYSPFLALLRACVCPALTIDKPDIGVKKLLECS